MGEPAKEIRLFASIRRLLATALELAQVRVALFSTELELEKRRIFDGLLLGAVAVVTLSVGLTLMCVFLILFFWDSYRLPAAGLLAFFLLGAGALLVAEARKKLKNLSGMFQLTLVELDRDVADLRPSDTHETR